jgi:hypothetical protein
MSKGFRWALAISGIVVLISGLLLAGALIGRRFLGTASFGPGIPGQGMMNPSFNRRGPGRLGSFGQPGPGMMGGPGRSGLGMPGGMMGGYGGGLSAAEPLSLQEAQQAVDEYLERLGNADLKVDEVMIFDNHAYAEIVEESTGVGAMEVLVDPVTLVVYPEHGPNMMWNLKYSPMNDGGWGMMGGMMVPGRPGNGYNRGQRGTNPPEVSADMPVTPEQAIDAAKEYLDAELPGATVGDHAEPFYGYYTLHIERDGQIIGMLSVNGFSAAVFPHTWHGDFIEMSEK